MNSLRAGLVVSLAAHSVAFGFLGWIGAFAHPAELLSGDKDQILAITLVAAPKNLPEPSAKTKLAAVKMVTVVSPKPAEIVKPKTAEPAKAPLPPAPVAVAKSPPAANQPAGNPTILAMAPIIPETHLPEKFSQSDGSSAQSGDDAASHQAAIGVRAQPDYRKNPEPPYPALAKRRHEEGLVLLRVVVNVLGGAKSVEIKQSSGFPLLDHAAVQAVKDWEFDPARIGSFPVESEIEIPVRFKLTQ